MKRISSRLEKMYQNFGTSLKCTKHRHYVDIYIPSINKCIEVKSIWTYELDTDKVLAKQKSAKDLGYQYEIWIFNNKEQLIEHNCVKILLYKV